MTRSRSIFVGLVTAFALAGGAARADSRIILKVADALPPTDVVAVHGARYFMDLIARSSRGRVGFEYFPAERLGRVRDMLAMVQAGTADIGYLSPSVLGGALRLSSVAELPGLFDSACAGTRAFWALAHDGPVDRAEYRPAGVVPLFVAVRGPRQLLGRSPQPATPAELRALKVRAAGAADDGIVRALGAAPVAVAPTALAASFRQGQVDALLDRAAAALDVLPADAAYQTVGAGFGGSVAVYAINAGTLRRLPADLQRILGDAGAETNEHVCTAADAEERAARAELERRGVAAVRLDPVAATDLAARAAAVRRDWAAALDRRRLPGSSTLAAFLAALGGGKAEEP